MIPTRRTDGVCGMADTSSDPEVKAIITLLSVLEPLAPQARANVIEYVFKRLGIDGALTEATRSSPSTIRPAIVSTDAPKTAQKVIDIRSLAEEKKPKTVSEMIAVVAYYLENLAPEKRNYIAADDIPKYFKQANLPLPKRPDAQLVHAKDAGYLDTPERGKYSLNAVGHNLVVHRLPLQSEEKRSRRRRSVTKAGRRRQRKREEPKS